MPPRVDTSLGFAADTGYAPAQPNGTLEAVFDREFAEKNMYPKMSPTQKLVVVPGTFSCSNFSYMPLANSSRSVVAKLQAYFEWAKTDSKVIGMFPWHVNWLPNGGVIQGCDMRLGATDIPGVVPELEKIAAWIKANNSALASDGDRAVSDRSLTLPPRIVVASGSMDTERWATAKLGELLRLAPAAAAARPRCFIDPVWNASELYHDANHQFGSAW